MFNMNRKRSVYLATSSSAEAETRIKNATSRMPENAIWPAVRGITNREMLISIVDMPLSQSLDSTHHATENAIYFELFDLNEEIFKMTDKIIENICNVMVGITVIGTFAAIYIFIWN